ncbi:3-hydroxybutyryl-CoA dehydrogenase, partial [Sulfolobus sp. B1]
MIKRLGVVGAGTMGHGIAEVSALAGFEVYVIDVSWDFLNRAKQRINESLIKFYEKGILKEKPENVMSRI